MEKKLDLNDLEIDTIAQDETTDSLSEFSEGHGLTEVGASCNSCQSGCGTGSCTVKQK
ncbi:MAG: GE37468 family thiazolyl peptide [Pleurocapsa sp. SU_196_0]|nr:GE37468 family thiazolyl peptide [Pleurocapsa sp. SU_196_0]